MSTIKINGRVVSGDLVGGGDVCISCGTLDIRNGKVFVDGKEVQLNKDEKVINIEITGDVKSLIVDSCERVTVGGDVERVGTVSGDVHVAGNIGGSVSTVSGDVRCGDIAGSVSTVSGDINCI